MDFQLFALPFGGGNRYSLNSLRKCLPEHVEFIPLELPGRGERMDDPLLDNSPDLVADVYKQMIPLIDAPYALFGHCMGALLCFLVARRMADEKRALPSHLFVSGCPSPSTLKKEPAMELSDEDVKTTLLSFGTAEALLHNPSFLEMIQPIVQADFRVVGQYTYEKHSPLEMPITVILEKNYPLSREEALLWQKETVSPISVFQLGRGIKEVSPELTDFFKSKI